MKRTLKEELERIHSISYGKKVILEDDFVNTLLNPTEPKDTKVSDDPKKADLLNNDPKNFFANLDSINQPLTQQEYGSMDWHKDVETVQIALELLGYELPVHGVDGLFGPETAGAVKKYKAENNLISESTSPYDGGGNVKINKKVNTDIDTTLQSKIDAIASEYGKPFTITSGYRDPEYNSKVGGASKSQHLLHNAVDIVLANGTKEETLRFVSIASKNGIGGIGVYSPGVVHIDIRPSKVAWGKDHTSGSIPSWAASTLNDHLNSKIDGNYTPSSDNTISDETTLEVVTPDMVKSMSQKLKTRGVTAEELAKYTDVITSGGSANMTDLDLNNSDDLKNYAKLCDAFIAKRQPNLLNINGNMMARAAQRAFIKYHKYVPPELALAQLAAEGGVGNPDPNSRPIKTRNPFNVGNVDNGTDEYKSTVEDGIQTYYDLIARSYLGHGKTAADLLVNFTNKNDQRYASAKSYEKVVNSIAKKVNKLSKDLRLSA